MAEAMFVLRPIVGAMGFYDVGTVLRLPAGDRAAYRAIALGCPRKRSGLKGFCQCPQQEHVKKIC
jgi:hypothetical protein